VRRTEKRSSKMIIADDWSIEDTVSGLKISVECGKGLNRIHIERMPVAIADNRDFFFTKGGVFDGTGCNCQHVECEGKAEKNSG